MKNVLLVSGINITQNSSVCMANAAYIEGLKNNNCKVTVIMPSCDEADVDGNIHLDKDIEYIIIPTKSQFESRISKIKTGNLNVEENRRSLVYRLKRIIYKILAYTKRTWYKIIDDDKNLYSAHKYLMKNVLQPVSEISNKHFNYVLTMSSPPVTHKLFEIISSSSMITYDKWYQVWQDPWYYDIYGNKKVEIRNEEERLLKLADKIIYVSPLTWLYQMRYFTVCNDKMCWAYLPCYKEIVYQKENKLCGTKLGYFGEYFSAARNIIPLAKAIDETENYQLIVYGNGDIELENYHNVISHGRASIDVVNREQAVCDILVCICNLRGGQIPGKIYQYAGTNKFVLFILDGTDDEKSLLRSYFESFNRFIFCENNVEDIRNTLYKFTNNEIIDIWNSPVNDFMPNTVVGKILGMI